MANINPKHFVAILDDPTDRCWQEMQRRLQFSTFALAVGYFRDSYNDITISDRDDMVGTSIYCGSRQIATIFMNHYAPKND